MATCPECDAEIEVDEFDVDKGDLISCPECGSNLEVTSTSPVELEAADDDDDEDEDEDDEERRRRVRRGRRLGRVGRRRRGRRGLGRVTHPSSAGAPADAAGRGKPTCRNGRPPRSTGRSPSSPACIVAYSGGVDSAYLAWAATEVLGARALCITADSPSYPEHHRALAARIARDFGLHHEVIRTDEMSTARVPRQPGQPLLLLQARALYAPVGDRARRAAFP